MSKYEFSTPGLFKGLTADEAHEELERIREKHGVLSAEKVVEESRSEESVLHRVFEWDDAKAAAEYRLQQARTLIGNIRVVVTETQVTGRIRAFVNVVTEDYGKRTYVPLQRAMADKVAADDLLKQAKADMDSFVVKYSSLEQLNRVKNEMLLFLNDN